MTVWGNCHFVHSGSGCDGRRLSAAERSVGLQNNMLQT